LWSFAALFSAAASSARHLSALRCREFGFAGVGMRVLMISDVYFPRINGVSTSIQTFRRGLHATGHETLLIAPEYPGADAAADGEIIRIPSRYLPRDPEDRIMKGGALRRLKSRLGRAAFDLVHIQTPFVAHYHGVSLARALRLPVIESYHTYFEEYLHHYVPLAPRCLMRFIARRFTVSQCDALDALVVPSYAMQRALEDYGVRCPMHVIPTGMDMERFAGGDGARFRAQLGIAPSAPTLVHVGRIAYEKNIDFLLRMFARVAARRTDAVFIVAGEGPALNHCKSYAESLGLAGRTRFVGYLSRDKELLDCYRAGDVFVFSSRTETQGLVLLEAMALGVPVVSTAHMGTADIVNPQRGAVVAPDDEEEFAAIVRELLADSSRRSAMSLAGREYAAEWSAQAMTERLTGLYGTLRCR
jgi:1,2-diacylglycerol 3-alpha-glucosyltransferase